MAKSKPNYSAKDRQLSPKITTLKEREGPSRRTEYSIQELPTPMSIRASNNSSTDAKDHNSGGSHKVLDIQLADQLAKVGEVLLAKMYRLNQVLGYPDPAGHVFSEAFWQAGIIPNYPKICAVLSKRFPEHPSKLQLERVDRIAMDALQNEGEGHLQRLLPHVQLLLDIMEFREQALRLIFDVSSTIITLLPHQNSIILHSFMDLFCSFVRTNLFSENIPRKMILQVYDLLYMLGNNRDCDFYHRLAQFIESYDPPLKGLQDDLKFVSPRIGEVLEAVGSFIFLSADTKKLRNEGFLSPFHPRYPDILTNSAHPMRVQDLANVSSYRDWVLFGYLVCPDELLRMASIDIASVVLKENLVLTLFRDEYHLLHEDYQAYVLPRILESKKIAKYGRPKLKENDLEYSVARQVEKMLSEVSEHALVYCDGIHRERRMLLKQEIGRMVLFFADQPSLLAPNIQMVFSALALAQSEILWYFQHVGVVAVKSKSVRVLPVDVDPSDTTIGFLLDGMDRLCCLVRKYITAIKGYALSYLSSSATRIRFLLESPGIAAIELDVTLNGLFQRILKHLAHISQARDGNASVASHDLSELRSDWMSILLIVTSARSSINIRHLEKATASTGKEGLIAEGNALFSWSRCIDELQLQLSKYASLKSLYFFHQHLTAVFRDTMFGPEGHPEHCCAWLHIASSFPECASPMISEEVKKIGHDVVVYVESLIESIMGGLEGLINILVSEGGFGSLDMQLLPERAANNLNYFSRTSVAPAKSPKIIAEFSLPGHESYPENNESITMLEAALQRFTNLCSVLNDLEPICVLNQVFVLREYMRECILGNFRKKMFAMLKADNDLQRPSILEFLVRRHIRIIHLTEQHVSLDLTQGIKEILVEETFSGHVPSLHLFEKYADRDGGSATEAVCSWYVNNIVKDLSGAGMLFSPFHGCFKSPRPVGGYFADSFTNCKELESFVRLFGGYGVDRLDRMIKDHVAVLLNCIDTSLRSNREVLEAAARSMQCLDRIERESCLRQVLDMETVVKFCIQAGEALAFNHLLAEAAGTVLEDGAPLVYSLLSGTIKHLSREIPAKKEVRRLHSVANSIGVISDHDSEWILSIMEEVGGATDDSWSYLPYLFGIFMTSNVWYTTAFNVDTGGFNNNIHCLARCIHSLIVANERVRLTRELEYKEGILNGETHSQLSANATIKSALQTFIKFSSTIVMDAWNDSNRSHLVAKLIFLDRLCDLSPYLARSSLEALVPYAIIRSIYCQYYSDTPSMPLATSAASSPAISFSRPSPMSRHPQRQSSSTDSSSHGHEQIYDARNSGLVAGKPKLVRMSGPLEYSSAQKGKSSESSTSGNMRPGPLPRFAVSRSGPILYK